MKLHPSSYPCLFCAILASSRRSNDEITPCYALNNHEPKPPTSAKKQLCKIVHYGKEAVVDQNGSKHEQTNGEENRPE